MPSKCIFTLGTFGLSPSLLLLFGIYFSESLPCLSTLGYVNKPMVGGGMHIVCLHSAEKGEKAITCNYSVCFFIYVFLGYKQPSYLLFYFPSILKCCNHSMVHIYGGFNRKDAWRNTFNLSLTDSKFTTLFRVWAWTFTSAENCIGVQVNCA